MLDTTTNIAASVNGAWDALSALAVAYAFSVVGAIVLLIAGYLIANAAENWSYAGLKRVRGFDETLARFFSKILRYVILALVAVTVLAQFGVQTASVLAALGAAGLAIGLALQGTLQNIAAGIMLLVLKPFRAGEYIETGNVQGTVREIGLFATELKGTDGIYILAPNSTLWNTPVKNFTRNPARRKDIVIKLAAYADVERARAIVAAEAEAARAGNDRNTAPQVFVSERAEGKATLTLRFWAAPGGFTQSSIDMADRVAAALEREDVPVLSIS